ncbi:ATP-binding protein [Lentzea sp. NPDC005914]|uniref:sensor histidine kinase n=1 Tax=Lentzea sp. NPDC005914 TaxID=3154572 RepID=UPI0033CF52B1
MTQRHVDFRLVSARQGKSLRGETRTSSRHSIHIGCHTGPGGHVTITSRTRDGSTVELEVTNTGPVVPQDEIPALFEPFRRLHTNHPPVTPPTAATHLTRGPRIVPTSRRRIGMQGAHWFVLEVRDA